MVKPTMVNKTTPQMILIVMLCMMCVMSLLASDIYLPAMPNIAAAFNGKETDIQLTITVYLFGLSICQLVYGPLSDRFGRRKVLIIGTSIFILASIVCSLSKTLPQLIVARFFQALGACSGMVISRAIAADLYTRQEAAKVFTSIFPVVGASSAIAPIIGGYLTEWFHWQTCFSFLSLFGMTLWLLIVLFLAETKKSLVIESNTITVDDFYSILKNHSFIGFTTLVSCVYAAYFAYIAAVPFLFHKYGFTSHQIGYFFILLSIFYIVGNLTGRRLIQSFPINNVIIIGIVLFVLASFLMLSITLIGTGNNPYSLIIPMSIMTAGNGFLLPLGTASTVVLFPNAAGTASGLMGFLQLSTASIAVGLIGHLTKNQEIPLAVFMVIIALIVSTSFYYLIIREGAYSGEPI